MWPQRNRPPLPAPRHRRHLRRRRVLSTPTPSKPGQAPDDVRDLDPTSFRFRPQAPRPKAWACLPKRGVNTSPHAEAVRKRSPRRHRERPYIVAFRPRRRTRPRAPRDENTRVRALRDRLKRILKGIPGSPATAPPTPPPNTSNIASTASRPKASSCCWIQAVSALQRLRLHTARSTPPTSHRHGLHRRPRPRASASASALQHRRRCDYLLHHLPPSSPASAPARPVAATSVGHSKTPPPHPVVSASARPSPCSNRP